MKTTPKKLQLRFIGWFFLINAIFFWIGGFVYLRSMLLSSTLFQNLMVDFSSLSGKIFVLLFTLVNYLSYMMLLAFIPASVIFLIAQFFPRQRFIWCLSVLSAATGLFLIFLDSQIYAMFRFHLNAVLFHFILSRESVAIFDLSRAEQLFVIEIMCFIVLLECGLAWGVWKYIIVPGRFYAGRFIAASWFGCILFSYFTMMLAMSHDNNLFVQQTSSLPYYNTILSFVMPGKQAGDQLHRLSEQHYMQAQFSRAPMHYPRHPLHCMAKDKMVVNQPYHIILIMIDSLRFDSLQYMPNVRQFAQDNWQFMQHISGGNSTQAGLFSLFYSIPGTYWTAALEQNISPVFIDLLLHYDYTTKIIWSAEMRNPPMNKTIYQRLTDISLDGSLEKEPSQRDRDTTKKTVQFLMDHQHSSKPFFLNIFYNAPHAFCSSKSFPMIYKPAYEECSRMQLNNKTDPTPYYNSYLNTVHFIDQEIAQVLATLKNKGYLDHSIIIFTSDHGQEFNENHQNYWGHASNYSAYQVHVPLLIHWPGEPSRTITYGTNGYDLIPTLLTRLFQCTNPSQDYSIGRDLLNADNRRSFVLSSSYSNVCIIEPDRLTTLHPSGEISMTAPSLSPIPNVQLRENKLKHALKLMRRYYEG